MTHFCTYFDRGFLAQGVALADSLRQHAAESVLWVLCLDDATEAVLARLAHPAIRTVSLRTLESADPELAQSRPGRTAVEYIFTLSPCWPRYLLRQHPDVPAVTYLDADTYWFASPATFLAALEEASVLLTEHRHPPYLAHHARYGRFNVGILSFRNDEIGRACLDDWRERCIAWCHDRVEDGRYADQRYLDAWPARWGERVRVIGRPGINLAPWNWRAHVCSVPADGSVWVDHAPLELFHFARFRPLVGDWWFQSGQLEYGVMPWRLRQRIYGAYWRALREARRRIRRADPSFAFETPHHRRWHQWWRALVPRAVFGSDWLRLGPWFISGRVGLGRHSGQVLAGLRRWREAWHGDTTAGSRRRLRRLSLPGRG